MIRTEVRRYSISRIAVATIGVCLIGACFSKPAVAGDAPADIIAVLDLSGSMKTDGRGADRFTDFFQWLRAFAKPTDRIGVVAMGEGARLVSPLTTADSFSEESMENELRRREQYTDLAAGLENAYYRLKEDSAGGREKIIVLFSDGRIDLAGGEWALQNANRYLLDRLIPSLESDRIRVVAVVPDGLSADFQLLHELTGVTDGAYFRGLPADARKIREGTPERKHRMQSTDAALSAAAAHRAGTEPTSAAGALPAPPSAGAEGPEKVVVEGGNEPSRSGYVAVILLVFGVMAALVFGVAVYRFRKRQAVPDSVTELERMLDDVHSLRQLSSKRRLKNAALETAQAPRVPVPQADPKERLSLDVVAPFLEFEEKPTPKKKSRGTDDISAKPAFAAEDVPSKDGDMSLSTMETMLGIMPSDIERHNG